MRVFVRRELPIRIVRTSMCSAVREAANKNRTQRSIDGPSHVDCIDLVFRKGVLVPGLEEVATSWRRCLTAHHLDPEIQGAPHIITEKEIKDSSEPLRNVILHAQEELDPLYAIVGPQQYVVLLCNRDGVAIHHRGDESIADAYKDCGIWLGGVWSEQIEGNQRNRDLPFSVLASAMQP